MSKDNPETICDELDLAALKVELAEARKKADESTQKATEFERKLADAEGKLKTTTDTLNVYLEAEKQGLVKAIADKTDLQPEELSKRSVDELRIINSTIDHVKVEGTVKSVRGADGNSTPTIPSLRDGPVTAIMKLGTPKRTADGSITWEAPK
jgi:hypothetical protein